MRALTLYISFCFWKKVPVIFNQVNYYVLVKLRAQMLYIPCCLLKKEPVIFNQVNYYVLGKLRAQMQKMIPVEIGIVA